MRRTLACLFALLTVLPVMRAGDVAAVRNDAELRLRIVSAQAGKHSAQPAVAWLESESGTPRLAFDSGQHYMLLQKNRMFTPHLQVIPVGSVVQFPNADPFFHNVFSLFDGRRFDLGLYEAGASKSVTFSREGVSYIFCNIHPEMSAVVIALSTPLFAIADPAGLIAIRNIPPGDYKLHLWVEGMKKSDLDAFSRSLHLAPRPLNLGEFNVPAYGTASNHSDEFGRPYSPTSKGIY